MQVERLSWFLDKVVWSLGQQIHWCLPKPRMEIVHKKFPCRLQLSHMVQKSPIHETMLP